VLLGTGRLRTEDDKLFTQKKETKNKSAGNAHARPAHARCTLGTRYAATAGRVTELVIEFRDIYTRMYAASRCNNE
jgi:hypothetical protein